MKRYLIIQKTVVILIHLFSAYNKQVLPSWDIHYNLLFHNWFLHALKTDPYIHKYRKYNEKG